MALLVDLLDQFIFYSAPGLHARRVVKVSWEQVSGVHWNDLYLDAFQDAMAGELPNLSPNPDNTAPMPTRSSLAAVLAADLEADGDALISSDLNSGSFLTELARTMQARKLIQINGQNLWTDEYRQLLLDLLERAYARFKDLVTENGVSYSIAVRQEAGDDSLLVAAIENYLQRQFGIILPAAQPNESLSTAISPLHSEIPTHDMSRNEILAETNQITSADYSPAASTYFPTSDSQEQTRTRTKVRVYIASSSDVDAERRAVIDIISELNRTRAGNLGLVLQVLDPSDNPPGEGQSLAEIADIFIGILWLRFGGRGNGVPAGIDEEGTSNSERDFGIALQLKQENKNGWPKVVFYRSIRPPIDLLRLNIEEYSRVQQFFESLGTRSSSQLVYVYADDEILKEDLRSRLVGWINDFAVELAGALMEFGQAAGQKGQTSESAEYFEQAILIQHELGSRAEEVSAWRQLGEMQFRGGALASATDAFRSGLRISREDGDDEKTAEFLHQLGLVAAAQKNSSDSLGYYRQALDLLNDPQTAYLRDQIRADQAAVQEESADEARTSGDYHVARQAYFEALAARRELGDRTQAAIIWHKLGLLAADQFNWKDALAAYAQAMTQRDPNLDSPSRAEILKDQATAYQSLAEEERAENHPEAAVEAYRNALFVLQENGEDRSREAELYASMGRLAFQREIWEDAITNFGNALALLDLPSQAESRRGLMNEQAHSFEKLGVSQLKNEHWERAGSSFHEGLALAQELGDANLEGLLLYDLGLVSASQERWDQANSFYSQSLSRLEATSETGLSRQIIHDQAISLRQIGDEKRRAGNWASAEIAYIQVLSIKERLGESDGIGELLAYVGVVDAGQKRWQEALAYFQQARNHPDTKETAGLDREIMEMEADTLANLAVSWRETGNLGESHDAYDRALRVATELDDPSRVAHLRYQLGLNAAESGNWQEATVYEEQALSGLLDAAERSDAESQLAFAYEGLGREKRAAEDLTGAEFAYRASLGYVQVKGDRFKEAELLHTLGNLAIEQENWDEALVSLRRSLGIYNLMEPTPTQAKVIWDIGRAQRGRKRQALREAAALGSIARDSANWEEAEARYADALNLAKEMGDDSSAALHLEDLGGVASAQARWGEAVGYYDQALALIDPVEQPDTQIRIEKMKARAYGARGDLYQSEQNWPQAESDFRSSLSLALATFDNTFAASLYTRLGEATAAQGRLSEALSYYDQALNLFDLPSQATEQERALRGKSDALKEIGNSARKANDGEQAAKAFQSALEIERTLGNREREGQLLQSIGEIASSEGHLKDASDAFDKAATIFQEIGQDSSYERAHSDSEATKIALKRQESAESTKIGELQFADRQFDAAKIAFASSLHLAKELDDRRSQAELNYRLGQVSEAQKQWEQASEFYGTASALYSAPNEESNRNELDARQASVLQQLGNEAVAAGKWQIALTYYQRGIAHLQEPEHKAQRNDLISNEVTALRNLGESAGAMGDWHTALDWFRRASGLAALAGATDAEKLLSVNQAIALRNIAEGLRISGSVVDALPLYTEAESLVESTDQTVERRLILEQHARALKEHSDELASRGEWDQSTRGYQAGLVLAQELQDTQVEGDLLHRLGLVAASQEKWVQSLQYYDQALARFTFPEDDDIRRAIINDQAMANHRLGDSDRRENRFPEAELDYRGALANYQELGDKQRSGEVLFTLGMLAADQGQWETALANYSSALDQFDPTFEYRRDVRLYQASALKNLADEQHESKNFRDAERYYDTALAISIDEEDTESEPELLYALGKLSADERNWVRSIAYFDQAESAFRKINSSDRTVAVVADREIAERAWKHERLIAAMAEGDAARISSNWVEADRQYRQAVELAEELDEPKQEASSYHNLGLVEFEQGNWEQAIHNFDQASVGYVRTDNVEGGLQLAHDKQLTFTAQAEAAKVNGDLPTAQAKYEDALALAQKSSDKTGQANLLYSLGALFAARQNWQRSVEYYDQSEALFGELELPERRGIVEADHAIAVRALKHEEQIKSAAEGASFRADGQLGEAKVHYERSLSLARELDDQSASGEILFALGMLAADQGYWELAIDSYQASLQDLENSNPHRSDVKSYLTAAFQSLGDEQFEKSELENAEKSYQSAISLSQELGDSDQLADSLYGLGESKAHRQDWAGAIETFDNAAGLLLASGRLERSAQVSVASGRAARSLQQYALSESKYKEALSFAKQINDLPLQAEILYTLGSLKADQKDWEASTRYFDQALAIFGTSETDEHIAQIEKERSNAHKNWLIEQQLAAVAAGDQAKVAKQFETAEQEYTSALAFARELDDVPGQAALFASLGNINASQKAWAASLANYDNALELLPSVDAESKRNEIFKEELASALQLAQEYENGEKWVAATGAYVRSLNLAQRLGLQAEEANILDKIGDIKTRQNDWEGAADSYGSALSKIDPQNESTRISLQGRQLLAMQGLADEQSDAGEWASAERNYLKALTLAKEIQATSQLAEIFQSLGLAQAAQGNWSGALDSHNAAFNIVENYDLPEQQATILASIGDSQRNLVRLPEASVSYERARDIAQGLNDAATTAQFSRILGDIAIEQSLWQQAVTQYSLAQPYFETHASDKERRSLLEQQGLAFDKLGDLKYGEGNWSEAESSYVSALERAESLGVQAHVEELLYKLGLVEAAREDWDKAIDNYREALASYAESKGNERIQNHLAFALQKRGGVGEVNKNWAGAEADYRQAIELSAPIQSPEQLVELWHRLGVVVASQGRPDEALQAYSKGLALSKDIEPDNKPVEIEKDQARALFQIASAELAEDKFENAETHFREARNSAEELGEAELAGNATTGLAESLVAQGKPREGLEYFEKAGQVYASLELMEQWQDVSSRESALLLRLGDENRAEGRDEEAEENYRRALQISAVTGDHRSDGSLLFGLGMALAGRRNWREAVAVYDQAQPFLTSPGQAATYNDLASHEAFALEQLGQEDERAGHPDDAYQSYNRALLREQLLGNQNRVGLLWQKLAQLSALKNDWTGALRANSLALEALDAKEQASARNEVLHSQARILERIGDSQKRDEQWAEAAGTYHEAVAIAEELGELDTQADLYSTLGALAESQSKWEDARSEYSSALELYRIRGNRARQANTWEKLGDVARQEGRFTDSAAGYENALDLFRNLEDQQAKGWLHYKLGLVAGDQNKWADALEHHHKALSIFKRIGDRNAQATIWRSISDAERGEKRSAADEAARAGDAALDEGKWTQAESDYRIGLELEQELEDLPRQGEMLNNLGIALEAQMRWDEALDRYQTALAIFEKYGLAAAQVTALSSIGDVHRHSQNWSAAEAAYRQALALSEGLGDTARTGQLYAHLGALAASRENWEAAIDNYQEARLLLDSAGLAKEREDVEIELGKAERGAKLQAEHDYKHALELARATGNLGESGELLNELGLLAAEQNKWEDAVEYYQGAVDVFKKLENESDDRMIWRTAQATVLNNIGEAQQTLGDWNGAESAFSQALDVAQELGDRQSEAALLLQLGVTAQEQEEWDRALDFDRGALAGYTAFGDFSNQAEILERIGDIQSKRGELEAAAASYENALSLARTTKEDERLSRLLKRSGEVAQAQGNLTLALGYYDQAIPYFEGTSDTRNLAEVLEERGDVLQALERWAEAKVDHSRALELFDRLGKTESKGDLYFKVGLSAQVEGNLDGALVAHQHALAFYESMDQTERQAIAHEKLGDIHSALNLTDKAEDSYKQSLELVRQAGAGSPSLDLLLKLGALAEARERWDDAAEYLKPVLAEYTQSGEVEKEADILRRLGGVEMGARRWENAEDNLNRAYNLYTTQGLANSAAWCLDDLGILAQARRDWDSALVLFQEGIQQFRDLDEPLSEAHLLHHIAWLNFEMGDEEQADLYAQAAFALGQTNGSGEIISASQLLRGLLAFERQQFAEASDLFSQAVVSDPSNWSAHLQFGNALIALKEYPQAVSQAQGGLGQAPRWELGSQIQLTIASLQEQNSKDYKEQLRRARSLISAGSERRMISSAFLNAAGAVVRALQGSSDSALLELDALRQEPATPNYRSAYWFARNALLALSMGPRRFKGKPVLLAYFNQQIPSARQSRVKNSAGNSENPTVGENETSLDEPTSIRLSDSDSAKVSGDVEHSASSDPVPPMAEGEIADDESSSEAKDNSQAS